MGKGGKETYDQLLYHPCEDELNTQWATKKLQKGKGQDSFQLSCSKCFTPLTYTGRYISKDLKHRGDYEADQV